MVTPAAQIELGATLLAQKKYSEAEPLLLDAYGALNARDSKQDAVTRERQKQALTELIRLYEMWGKKDGLKKWHMKLEEFKR